MLIAELTCALAVPPSLTTSTFFFPSQQLVARQKEFFSKLVVDAVSLLDDLLPLNMIGVKKIQGGALEVSARYRRAGIHLVARVCACACGFCACCDIEDFCLC